MDKKRKNRKRKLSQVTNEDDDNKKLSRTEHTGDDNNFNSGFQGRLEMDDDDDENDADNQKILQEPEEEPLPPSDNKSFDMKKFRASLRQGDCIIDIRQFLQKAAENPLIVSEFYRAGGKPLEFTQPLKKIDKNELFHISYVFNGVHLLLIEKLTKSIDLTKETEAIEACAFIINNHRSSIEKLLSSNYASHKRSVLRLLTAIVYLAPHLGRELLTTLNVVFNVESLQRFTSHEKSECNLPDEDRVRTCYIYFIMAYIIEGNYTLIKNLLDRNELVLAVVSGLIYDSEKTVCLVLNSLLKFVLKSESVSKTKKIQVFNLNVVKELLRLFDWKGPDYFKANCNRKLKDKAEQYVKAEELSTITETAYEFLKELLASRKHGIAFKCLGQRRLKFNAVQKRLLPMIDDFWQHKHKGDLVIEIIKACPELAKYFIQKHAPRLDTFRKHNNWHQVADFFTRLIDQMSPDVIQYHVDKMNAKETIDLIKEVCMAAEILQQLRSKHSLKNQNLDIRHKSAKLLYGMFKQCDNYLFSLSKWDVYRTSDLKKIKFEIINHILLMCPSVENILLSLHMSQVDETIDSAGMFEHLECILDLLLIITKCIPSFIDTTSSVINYIKILGPIYELNREQENSTRIEFKAVKLLLALEPKALSPNTEMFGQVLQSFFNVYRFGSALEKYEAKLLLRRMFNNTGMFENGSLETDLWLRALDQLDEDVLGNVKSFLVKCIKGYDVAKNQQKDNKQSSSVHLGAEKNINEIFDNIQKGRTIKGVLDVPTLGKFFHFIVEEYQRNVNADKADNQNDDDDDDDEIEDMNEGVLQYIENVAFSLFHYFPASEEVLHSLAGVSHQFSKYMKGWVQKSKPGKLPLDFEPKIFSAFYEVLANNQSRPFLDLFKDFALVVDQTEEAQDDLRVISVAINGVQYKLTGCLTNETDIMTFIYTMIFFVGQLHKNDSLDSELSRTIIAYIKECLNILKAITSRNGEISKSGFELNNNDNECVSKALRYIFTNCFYLLNSFDIWSDRNQVTTLMYELVKHVPEVDYLDEILVHYRKKICNQIELAAEETAKKDQLPKAPCEQLSNVLTVFRLDHENCCHILECLASLNFKYFVTPENDRSIFASILAYALERLAEIKMAPLDNSVFQRISTIYIDLVCSISVEINYEVTENALFVYLSTFFQNFADVNQELFAAVFKAKKLTKASVKLAGLLLERKQDLVTVFKELLPAYLTKRELIYPLINVIADTKCKLDDTILLTVYNEFKNGIMKAIEKPFKAAVIYKENVFSSIFLIEHCMPLDECVEFLNKTVKFESTDVFQLQLIKSIHLKVLMGSKEPNVVKQAYVSFLKIFIQLIALLLKRENLEYDRVNSFAVIAYQWAKLKERMFSDAFSASISYESIHGSANWLQLAKSCLKHGLKVSIDESTKKINDDSAVLLKLLAFLCNDFYADNKLENDAQTIFEMAMTHPKFFDIVTSQRKSAIKTNLMYLIYTLVKKNPNVSDAEHIPVLLSAYQAKLSHCDQYILATLQMYEAHGINFHKYKPFFWGENALSHYSLSLSAITKTTLLQEPPMMQLMTLIDKDVCENTLVNFPIWRRSNVIDQTPEVEFQWNGIIGDEQTNNVTLTRNNIEWLIEHNVSKVDPDLLLTASRRDEVYEDVYDPAFLIPLMQMAFAPETVTKPVRPAQNGLLAVTFAALSSSDKNMRLGAAVALQRYRNHLETAKFVDSKLWFHMFDSVQNGLNALTTEMRKTKKSRIPRVPYIAGLFFARTINTLVNPLSEMYRPLSTFLLIKNAFNFLTVPEFNVLFHSPDVNYNVHRGFILDILRDGTKCSSDLTILLTGNIFKAVLGFYGSPMSNREKNLQILNVINSAIKIPKSAKLMIELIGIVPWLNFVADNTEFFQFDMIDILCVIISNLYYSVQINKSDYSPINRSDIDMRMLLLLLKLCPKLSPRISEVPFMRYLNILLKLSTIDNRSEFLKESDLEQLIKCSAGYVSEQLVCELNFIKTNYRVSQHCERKYTYVHRLRNAGLDEQKVFILATLREIIINWSHSKCKNV